VAKSSLTSLSDPVLFAGRSFRKDKHGARRDSDGVAYEITIDEKGVLTATSKSDEIPGVLTA
jgi:hypothetical protein